MTLRLVTSAGKDIDQPLLRRSRLHITELIIAREYYRWVDCQPRIVVAMSTALCEGKGMYRDATEELLKYLEPVDREKLEKV